MPSDRAANALGAMTALILLDAGRPWASTNSEIINTDLRATGADTSRERRSPLTVLVRSDSQASAIRGAPSP
jgi:hypothetical protein